MINGLVELKKEYFHILDKKARHIAHNLVLKKKVTKLLLKYIHMLYISAQAERKYKNEYFGSAYHQPITSDLEFMLARIFHHYSLKTSLDWEIYLRKQIKDTSAEKLIAPDIRIERNGEIVSIIEIKAKAGWMQPFFSERRKKGDLKKGLHPEKQIEIIGGQIKKYSAFKRCGNAKVFVLLPTFIHVHRNKYNDSIEDYRSAFANNSKLKKENLILLSANPSLDLAAEIKDKDLLPTDDFEKLISKISKY